MLCACRKDFVAAYAFMIGLKTLHMNLLCLLYRAEAENSKTESGKEVFNILTFLKTIAHIQIKNKTIIRNNS
jgi:hypothetical protein